MQKESSSQAMGFAIFWTLRALHFGHPLTRRENMSVANIQESWTIVKSMS